MISFYKYNKYLVNWLKKYYFCKEIAHHTFKTDAEDTEADIHL